MPPINQTYESETVYAQPAYRVIAMIDMGLAEPEMRQVMQTILDRFLQAAGDRIALYAYSGGKVKTLSGKKFTPKAIAKARDLIALEDWKFPTTLRFNGFFNEPHDSVAPPHLRFEQCAELGILQIELPPEDAGLVAFSDDILKILADVPVLWGAMGFGMYQPTSIDSLIWMLPRVTPRYACAIEVQPDFAQSFLRRRPTMEDLRLQRERVLTVPDLGWKTLIGSAFYDRLPDLDALPQTPDVAVDRLKAFTAITAGKSPVWGDVNLGEDIAAFRAVGQALHPVRPEWIRVKHGLFGGFENDNGLDRLEAWYERFGA